MDSPAAAIAHICSIEERHYLVPMWSPCALLIAVSFKIVFELWQRESGVWYRMHSHYLNVTSLPLSAHPRLYIALQWCMIVACTYVQSATSLQVEFKLDFA